MHFWLLVLLIPGTIVLLLIDSWSDYQVISRLTREVYDTALLEPAKVLETSIEFNEDGTLRIDPPFYAQAMLESKAGNRKYFRVEEIDPPVPQLGGISALGLENKTLAGMEGLPKPGVLPQREGMPVFYNGMYRNDEVRMVGLWRDLHYDGGHRQVLVLVGESLHLRLTTQQEAWRQGLFRDARMILVAVLLVWFSVEWALRPLGRLRREIRAREVENLMPLDVEEVPREIVPLVKAVNHHIGLYRQVLDKEAQFLADASHQMRTPLAIMLTQAQYARREPDIQRVRESLDAIVRQLGRTSRLTEQLLSLAHASGKVVAPQGKVDLNALARDIVLQYLPLARERSQDLGWADSNQGMATVLILGSEAELHESIANLVHNAINHAGDGSSITVSAGAEEGRAWVSVRDNGVGLDHTLRDSVFARFDRGGATDRGEGSGLGLAIALAYAERNRGTIELRDGDVSADGGCGLCAILWLPLWRE
ncbi:sensor histidine kinase [Allopusillimonas ginsengisoli]|uniref:sensor histidine kinase n=1 Tax=Allopusillimonas ginsengisoli TaxID=453575 RepID=UPI0039C0BB9A